MGFKRMPAARYAMLRRAVYERDGGACVLCGAHGAHIHHVVFRSQGGKDAADNLVTLCGGCHERAHGVIRSRYTQAQIREMLLEYLERNRGGCE